MSTATVTHPEWCTRPHRPGADPRRQSHEHVWRQTDTHRRGSLKIELYPCGPADFRRKYERDGGSFFVATLGDRAVGTWLSVRDLRELAASLLDIADAAEYNQ